MGYLKQLGAHMKLVAGIVLVALTALPVDSAFAGEWFRYTEAYAGVERTYYQSPQCRRGEQQLTSNLGVRQHIYTFSRNLTIIGSYTHHSCVIGGDWLQYDALGMQLNWRFERK